MSIDYLAGLVECPIDGCEPDDDGWAHGIEHVHYIDRDMVREADLTGQTQAELDALADLIERVRSRPGITSADMLAHAILDAGWHRTPKEPS